MKIANMVNGNALVKRRILRKPFGTESFPEKPSNGLSEVDCPSVAGKKLIRFNSIDSADMGSSRMGFDESARSRRQGWITKVLR